VPNNHNNNTNTTTNNNNNTTINMTSNATKPTIVNDEDFEKERQNWIKVQKRKEADKWHKSVCLAYQRGKLTQAQINSCNSDPNWTWDPQFKLTE